MRRLLPWIFWIVLALIALVIFGAQDRGLIGGNNVEVAAVLVAAAFAVLFWRRPNFSAHYLFQTAHKIPKAKALVIGATLFLSFFVWLLASIVLFHNGYIAVVPFVILCTAGTFVCIGVAVMKVFELVSRQ
jgi:hypothetical protein